MYVNAENVNELIMAVKPEDGAADCSAVLVPVCQSTRLHSTRNRNIHVMTDRRPERNWLSVLSTLNQD